jgi:hypothetical protein
MCYHIDEVACVETDAFASNIDNKWPVDEINVNDAAAGARDMDLELRRRL